MTTAGIGHLTFAREEFQAQVPNWFPANKDFVVLSSGVVEIAMGAALLDNDRARLVRLFGQPALIAMALWSAGIPKK